MKLSINPKNKITILYIVMYYNLNYKNNINVYIVYICINRMKY